MDRVLPGYPPDRSRSAERQLERLGVDRPDEHARDRHHRARGRRSSRPPRPADAAASASRRGPCSGRPASRPRRSRKAVAAATGAETDKAGRIKVGPDLTIPGHPEIFVIGDAAVQPWKPDRPVPGVAQGGIQGGKYVGAARSSPRLDGEDAAAVPVPATAATSRSSAGSPGVTNIPLARAVRARPAGSSPGSSGSASTSLPDRVREPARRADPLGVELLHPRPRVAPDHRASRSCPTSRSRSRPHDARPRPDRPEGLTIDDVPEARRYEARIGERARRLGRLRPGPSRGSSRSTPRCCPSSAAAGSPPRWSAACSTTRARAGSTSRRAARSSGRTSSATRRTRDLLAEPPARRPERPPAAGSARRSARLGGSPGGSGPRAVRGQVPGRSPMHVGVTIAPAMRRAPSASRIG